MAAQWTRLCIVSGALCRRNACAWPAPESVHFWPGLGHQCAPHTLAAAAAGGPIGGAGGCVGGGGLGGDGGGVGVAMAGWIGLGLAPREEAGLLLSPIWPLLEPS